MLRGKKVLVTSGGTQEYIDEVRVMTNISSGKLGAEIATALISNKADVTYLHGINAALPKFSNVSFFSDGDPFQDISIKTAQDAYNTMERLVPNMDAVIHCMAVSDFTFNRDIALKCKSSDPQAFIDYMARSITTNPKIISKVKEWNPNTCLIGFKFEVGIPNSELISLAKASIEKNKCDLVIANDKEEFKRDANHTAYFVYAERPGFMFYNNPLKVSGKEEIAEEIALFLKGVLK